MLSCHLWCSLPFPSHITEVCRPGTHSTGAPWTTARWCPGKPPGPGCGWWTPNLEDLFRLGFWTIKMVHLYLIIILYPLVNQQNHRKSPCLMAQSTMNEPFSHRPCKVTRGTFWTIKIVYLWMIDLWWVEEILDHLGQSIHHLVQDFFHPQYDLLYVWVRDITWGVSDGMGPQFVSPKVVL